MTLETLELLFKADMRDVNIKLAELSEAITGMSETARAAGAAFTTNFRDGIAGFASAVAATAKDVAQTANFNDASGVMQARSAGMAVGQGFANGILAKRSAVNSAAGKLASSAAYALKLALKISSPSKLARELGGHFSGGFALGVSDGTSETQAAARGLSVSAVRATAFELPMAGAGAFDASALVNAVREGLSALSVSVPINVDGVKLGEAAIGGINAVMKSAGRMLIDI